MSARVAPIRSRRRAVASGPRPPYLRAALAVVLLVATLVLTAGRPEPAEGPQRSAASPDQPSLEVPSLAAAEPETLVAAPRPRAVAATRHPATSGSPHAAASLPAVGAAALAPASGPRATP